MLSKHYFSITVICKYTYFIKEMLIFHLHKIKIGQNDTHFLFLVFLVLQVAKRRWHRLPSGIVFPTSNIKCVKENLQSEDKQAFTMWKSLQSELTITDLNITENLSKKDIWAFTNFFYKKRSRFAIREILQ